MAFPCRRGSNLPTNTQFRALYTQTPMNILILNAGSPTLKFRLFRIERLRPLSEPEEVVAGGLVERIGTPDARLTVTAGEDFPADGAALEAPSAGEAAREVIRRLTGAATGGEPAQAIDAVGTGSFTGDRASTNPRSLPPTSSPTFRR